MLSVAVFFVWCAAFGSAQNRENFDLFPELPVNVIDTENVICKEHSRTYVENLRNLSLWAYQMRDSTAKSVTGILTGNIFQFGHYEECLKSKSPFPTQYCLAAIKANIPEPDPPRDPKSLYYEPNESVLRKIYNKGDPSQQPEDAVLMGWCVPASCRPDELEQHLNKYLENVNIPLKQRNVTYAADIAENSCQKEGENSHLDHADISFGLVTVIIVLLVILSTAYDLLRNVSVDKLKGTTQFTKLMLAFSIRRNFRRLPQADGSNSSLRVLYGVRVMCICMIILDHRFGTHMSSGILNFNDVEEKYRTTALILVTRGDLVVDSFFILSGILVTYSLLLQYDKRFINPGLIVFLRYVRLTPLYAFVIFYYATLMRYSGEGPMWKTIVVPEVEDCRDNWWTNLLYINNYVNVDRMCMVQSWYLPCDFHYFIIAVLICISIHKNKKFGLILLAVVTFFSILIPFIITVVYEVSAVVLFYPDFLRQPKAQPEFMHTYSKSHTRASPYFIGMIFGYIYYRMRDSEKCLKKGYSQVILFLSTILIITSVMSGVSLFDPYYNYNPIEAGLYAAMHRPLWAMGSTGILYVASFGHAKFLYRFMSWKPWIPISKLVYGAYLVHFQFQLRAVARKAGADAVTYFDVVYYGLSDIALAFLTAFILYLTVEAPIRNIFNLLLVPHKGGKRPNTDKKPDQESVSETTCDTNL